MAELWASKIKQTLYDLGIYDRPVHIISANLHSVINSLYGKAALKGRLRSSTLENLATKLSMTKYQKHNHQVRAYGSKHGLLQMEDVSGTNIEVQIIDTEKIDIDGLPAEVKWKKTVIRKTKPIILVMDYAFGEQAYEVMDELLKPFELNDHKLPLNVESINIMGKAGVLRSGVKGDIMIPSAHIFEGSADNYPFENDLRAGQFENNGVQVFDGSDDYGAGNLFAE